MHKIFSFLLLSIYTLFICSCNSDDSEKDNFLTAEELLQTTWNVKIIKSDEIGNGFEKESLVVFFMTETKGRYAIEDDNGSSVTWDFTYQIDNKIIAFQDSPLGGIWTVVEKSKKQIVLQESVQGKDKAILTRNF